MAGRIRFTFRLRMLLLLLGTCWLLAAAFMIFQYHREKEYKAGLMNTSLQMHNTRILDDLAGGEDIGSIVARISTPAEQLRITVIDREGNVMYDSRPMAAKSNHNSRPEVIAARDKGTGYAIGRMSEEDSVTYFYSAMAAADGTVIRSAAPYTHSLSDFLKVDRTIFWITGAMTLAVSLIGLLATRKTAISIRRLSMFAAGAEKGERIYDGYSFPRDELGSIAANIVRLYVQRDEQNRRKIQAEQDKARLKKQLTDNINHELKTPVASILVNLDLLDDHPDLSEDKKREVTSRIRANAMRLSALLKDVSALARMDDGRALTERRRLDLTAIIHKIADEARLRTDMAIIVNVPTLIIDGDRTLLESIFHNLIDNAIVHSGGTMLSITSDTEGRFHVRDNGRGVAPVHLPHIFERFYRADDGRSRQAGGTGLGLAIVRNAVAVHGGTISVRCDGGLVFDFTLPVV